MGEATKKNSPLTGPFKSAPIRAGPFSGPQCSFCPTSLTPDDEHLACFRLRVRVLPFQGFHRHGHPKEKPRRMADLFGQARDAWSPTWQRFSVRAPDCVLTRNHCPPPDRLQKQIVGLTDRVFVFNNNNNNAFYYGRLS